MKSVPLIIVGILLLISCNATRKASNPVSDAEKIAQQYFEFFNRHEWEEMAGLDADSAEFKDPALGPGIVKQTKHQIIEKYKQLHGFLPDLHAKIVNLYPSGASIIIIEFISTGASPGGFKIELPICSIFTIDQGKIIKDYTYYDNLAQPSSK